MQLHKGLILTLYIIDHASLRGHPRCFQFLFFLSLLSNLGTLCSWTMLLLKIQLVNENSQWMSQLPPLFGRLLYPLCAHTAQLSLEFPYLRKVSDWWLGSALAGQCCQVTPAFRPLLAVQGNASREGAVSVTSYRFTLIFPFGFVYWHGNKQHQ